jgi:spore coat protein U-like protein
MSRNARFVRVAMALGAVAGITAVAATRAAAETDSRAINVTAAVTKACTVNTVAVAFGSYDVNAASDTDQQGGVTVACTKGVNATISLGGANDSRVLTGPGGATLSYGLYQNSARSTAWDASNAVTYASLGRAPQTLSVYARIPKNQDVTFGSYTADVLATINF